MTVAIWTYDLTQRAREKVYQKARKVVATSQQILATVFRERVGCMQFFRERVTHVLYM